ncbi:MAG: hypothetical protein E7570_03490 [Ruminococcaceae bacterium]|nr:hypothetical protein [Oscillospiraceae bacterium]
MIFYAKDFGNAANFSECFAEAVKKLNNGDTISFENTEYHFFKDYSQNREIHMSNTDSLRNPNKYFAMLLENLEDITLEGNGAEFVIHGDICALGILNCKNITLKDFTIKYYSPSVVEMKVKSIEKKNVVFALPEHTQFNINENNIEFFEKSPFSDRVYWNYKNDENSFNQVVHIDKNVFRIPNDDGVFHKVKDIKKLSDSEIEITYSGKPKFISGAVYTITQNKNRNTSGVFVNESENISAQRLNINYLQGFGWLSQMCCNLSFEECNFVPEENRCVSSFADLIHISSCKGSVDIKKCNFAHPHDDAINIHGVFLRFKEKLDSKSAVFEFVHEQQGGYRAFHTGNKVKFYYRDSLEAILGEFTVKQAIDYIDGKSVSITFEEELPEDIEATYDGESNIVIENVTYCPDVEICDCKFEAIPTRGILCTTSGKVRIHDNSFSHILMSQIYISNDADEWYESGPVRDMEIYSNSFYKDFDESYEDSDSPVILIEPITLGGKIKAAVHRNIKIFSNNFETGKAYPVKAEGVENIGIFSNVFKGKAKIKLKHYATQNQKI